MLQQYVRVIVGKRRWLGTYLFDRHAAEAQTLGRRNRAARASDRIIDPIRRSSSLYRIRFLRKPLRTFRSDALVALAAGNPTRGSRNTPGRARLRRPARIDKSDVNLAANRVDDEGGGHRTSTRPARSTCLRVSPASGRADRTRPRRPPVRWCKTLRAGGLAFRARRGDPSPVGTATSALRGSRIVPLDWCRRSPTWSRPVSVFADKRHAFASPIADITCASRSSMGDTAAGDVVDGRQTRARSRPGKPSRCRRPGR